MCAAAGDGCEGSLKVPIEESESKRRSDEPQLTKRKSQQLHRLQNDRKSTRDVSEKPILFFFSTTWISSSASPCRPCVSPVTGLPTNLPGLQSRSIALFQKGNSDPAIISATPRVWHGQWSGRLRPLSRHRRRCRR